MTWRKLNFFSKTLQMLFTITDETNYNKPIISLRNIPYLPIQI